MNHKERFFATINREPVDYPASWFGMPTSTALPGLFKYFRVESMEELKRKVDDDVFPIERAISQRRGKSYCVRVSICETRCSRLRKPLP